MILKLSEEEIKQIRYILPVQGNIKTLELVQKILDKTEADSEELEFDDQEVELIKKMVHYLDQNQKINLSSLSLIQKILKETK